MYIEEEGFVDVNWIEVTHDRPSNGFLKWKHWTLDYKTGVFEQMNTYSKKAYGAVEL
jgi:hypothetical protein